MLPRFALLAILASSALHATSFASATCQLGTIIQTGSRCSIPFDTDGIVSADAEVNENITSTSATILLSADAGAVPTPDVTWYAAGSASDSLTFATAGPQRPGFISLLGNAVGEHGGDASADITENQMHYCCSVPMLPFELGSVFQVSLSANAAPGGCEFDGCTQAVAEVQFSLTEADGTTPVPFFTLVTPEPASWRFLLFGLTACAVFYVRTRKAGLGCHLPAPSQDTAPGAWKL
jgi:hypothetical protein